MNWRHKMALEHWAGTASRGRFIRLPNSVGIGEKTFQRAIDRGWLALADADDKRRWWEADYRLTDKGIADLADATFTIGCND